MPVKDIGQPPVQCLPLLALQVLDEIGVDLSAAIGNAPQKKVAAAQQQAVAEAEDSELQDLAARLAMLRN